MPALGYFLSDDAADRTMRVGMVGLGIMGGALAGNLIKSGFAVSGFDPDGARLAEAAAKGVLGLASPALVAAASDVVITSLPGPQALHSAVEGTQGVCAGAGSGLVVVETSTLALSDKERAHDALARAGSTLLDCPLSGTGAQAAAGEAVVYASGDKGSYERCVPVFEGLARAHHYLGRFGNGSRMKYLANLLVAVHNAAAAEAIVLGRKAGLDPDTVYRVIKDGAGASRMFEVRGPLMVRGEYSPPAMKVEIWQKDLDIIARFAAGLGCPTPLFTATLPLYFAAAAGGRGGEDTASVCAVLESLAGIPREAEEA